MILSGSSQSGGEQGWDGEVAAPLSGLAWSSVALATMKSPPGWESCSRLGCAEQRLWLHPCWFLGRFLCQGAQIHPHGSALSGAGGQGRGQLWCGDIPVLCALH